MLRGDGKGFSVGSGLQALDEGAPDATPSFKKATSSFSTASSTPACTEASTKAKTCAQPTIGCCKEILHS